MTQPSQDLLAYIRSPNSASLNSLLSADLSSKEAHLQRFWGKWLRGNTE